MLSLIRKASIDIGTNSTRLLITDIDSSGNFFPLLTKERVTRLGEGLDHSLHLSRQAMLRVLIVLKEYLDLCKKYFTKDIAIFATSATRDAVNRDEFIEKIYQTTGYHCRLLPGAEEAYLSFLGVISDYQIEENFLVCDVGGGSTEFVFGRNKNMMTRTSLNIGSRRMTREFFHSDPVKAGEISAMKTFISNVLKNEPSNSPPLSVCVCVGGTAATLAMMDKKIDLLHPERAHQSELSFSALTQIIMELEKKTIKERQSIKGLNPERASVILAGALIIECIMEFYSLTKISVSLRDLLFGILMENGSENEHGQIKGKN